MSAAEDRTMPEGRWAFDADVTDAFNDMLQRSIPDYDAMRRSVTDITCWHAKRWGVQGAHVVDLGCSRGEALAPILDRLGVRANFTGLEISEPMLEAATERFQDWENVAIRRHDLRGGLPDDLRVAQVILSVLTLQFTPLERRQAILKSAYDHLAPGGAFVLVEKVLGASADLDEMMVDLYYALKRENGYSQEAIDRKRLSLEGVLVPVTYSWNVELLRTAGFTQVDGFWRWQNFCGLVAVK